MKKSEIDFHKIEERLEYLSETGEFLWKRLPGNSRTINSWNTRYAGKIAGTIRCVNKDSGLYYKFINIEGIVHRAHHLVWLFEHGSIPAMIDHLDGNGLNNKIDNLRELSMSDNIRKARIQVNNTSGYKGVSFRKDTGKWTARTKIDGKYVSLGSFCTKEEAFEIYSQKVLEIAGEIHLDLITRNPA